MAEKKNVWDWAYKGISLSIICTIAYWLISEGKTNEMLRFSNQEIKVNTETHTLQVDPAKLAEQKAKDAFKSYKDSISEAKFRKTQDSVDQVRDSMTRLGIRQNYNLNKKIDSLFKAVDNIH